MVNPRHIAENDDNEEEEKKKEEGKEEEEVRFLGTNRLSGFVVRRPSQVPKV